MSDVTSKPASNLSSENTLRSAFNDVDSSITTNGFLVGKVGHKVTAALSTTSIANDTITYSFFDGSTALYQLKLVFPSAQTLPLLSAERIS
jgi:hypothetical protein